jgi:predicted DNA-binding transcriptional regulator AlpA
MEVDNFERQSDSALLRERDAARFLSVATATLQDWRHHGRGPRYLKLGKAVRYKLGDLREWLDAQAVEPASVSDVPDVSGAESA